MTPPQPYRPPRPAQRLLRRCCAPHWLEEIEGDLDFLAQYDIEVVARRGFSEHRPADRTEGFVLNEAAVRVLGWASPAEAVGNHLVDGNRRPKKVSPILGVVKDFHYAGLQAPIEPLLILAYQTPFNYVSLRVRTDNLPGLLAGVENAWQRSVPDRPFDYFFLDDDFDRQYHTEQRLGRLFLYFSGLALFIAGLGLFGLAAFTAAQRTKEIGIRKALGATVADVVLLISRDFTRLVLVGVALATPMAYLMTNRWLDAFAYRIEISWPIFLVAGLTALGIALLTVSYQAIRAALVDPVKSLRHD